MGGNLTLWDCLSIYGTLEEKLEQHSKKSRKDNKVMYNSMNKNQ